MAIATVRVTSPFIVLPELADCYHSFERYLFDLDTDPKAVAKRLREIAEGMSE